MSNIIVIMNCYFLCCFFLILVTYFIIIVLRGIMYCIIVGMFIYRRNYKYRKLNNIIYKLLLLIMVIF